MQNIYQTCEAAPSSKIEIKCKPCSFKKSNLESPVNICRKFSKLKIDFWHFFNCKHYDYDYDNNKRYSSSM